ncbi:methyltransferase domain-containing protein [Niastella populi]|uniref:Methyltransferase domain-containing protein n=1 Tax=Niastella populi TaxID=550983 RepID=A0A1V9EJ99_9BACT|nr:methyltransferase domain-containing protein [Niastella populi]OQP46210.1 hypothetical protein A4R26_32080 [Niastella populi]
MQLLSEEKLVWSPTVANSRMNRERNSSGINSYEQELKFKPEEFLLSKIKELGNASWIDICCGQGKALIQTSNYFYKLGLQDNVLLEGIDLVEGFSFSDNETGPVKFQSQSVINWIPSREYDLITCVHGIHYIGDKLKVIEILLNSLTSTGLFIANLDLNNIAIKSTKSNSFLKNLFLKKGITYDSRKKLLSRTGKIKISFDLVYLGADDNYGPNYTGQDSVTSYYED